MDNDYTSVNAAFSNIATCLNLGRMDRILYVRLQVGRCRRRYFHGLIDGGFVEALENEKC